MLHQFVNLIDSKYFNFDGVSPIWLISKVRTRQWNLLEMINFDISKTMQVFGMAPYVNRFQKYNVTYINVFVMILCFSMYIASFIVFQNVHPSAGDKICIICLIGDEYFDIY